MTMADTLAILGSGAVTAVGLTAAQTCAAIRAGIKRFSPIEAQLLEDDEPQVGARVSADPRLRADDREWLLNLAGRALRECSLTPETPLVWQVPEAHRGHPLAEFEDAELFARLASLVGHPLSERSRIVRTGAAGIVEALAHARELCSAGQATRCILGGADSLLRKPEIDRLASDQRLLGPGRAQGLVPGEGAAFVVVGPSPGGVEIRGLGLGYEEQTVLEGRRSVGDAFVEAFGVAIEAAGFPEGEIDFVAGNFNGERYDAWEVSHTHARCYQTRRERLPVMWPAASTGELGVASGALALLAASAAIEQGYALGPTAAVQIRSEGELRGLVLIRAGA